MRVLSAQLFTRAQASRTPEKILQFPLCRIIVAVLFLVSEVLFHNLVVMLIVEKLPQPWFTIALDAVYVADILLMLFLYRQYVRRIERREALEISLPGSAREFAGGALIALGLVGSVTLLLVLTGNYRIESTASPWILLHALIRFTSGAFLQVLLFRVILFRLGEELLGTYLAFALVAVIFGFAHMLNENVTPLTFAALVIGDLLLLAAFALTRRIWLVWGIHAGWNFFQDGVFGMPNSGVTELPSWITPAISGPDWLNGGYFGIEASAGGILLSVLAGIWVSWLAIRRGQIVRPLWRRAPALSS